MYQANTFLMHRRVMCTQIFQAPDIFGGGEEVQIITASFVAGLPPVQAVKRTKWFDARLPTGL